MSMHDLRKGWHVYSKQKGLRIDRCGTPQNKGAREEKASANTTEKDLLQQI